MNKTAPTLVLTPLPLEKKLLLKALGGEGERSQVGPSSVIRLGSLALAVGGHGKVAFALSTQHLIRELKPRLVIAVGCAGALNSELQPLDVLAAEAIVEHDFRLRFAPQPPPRFECDATALNSLRSKSDIRFGILASGDEDVVERTRAEEISAQTGAVAVAWEGAGLARACRWWNTPFLELRTITDTASSAAPHDFKKNLEIGMGRIAQSLRLLTDGA